MLAWFPVRASAYVGVTLDWWPCGTNLSGGDWCGASVLDADLSKIDASLLRGAVLRVGGSMDVEARYDFGDLEWCEEPRLFRGEKVTLCLRRERYEAVMEFVRRYDLKLVWGLNYPGAAALGDSGTVPPWNSTNARQFVRETQGLWAVELGEELDPEPGSRSFRNLVDAYRELGTWGVYVLGPCAGMSSEWNGTALTPFLEAFLRLDLVDAVCAHAYDNEAWDSTMPPKASLSLLELVRNATSKPLWCGECGPHNQGGTNLTDKVASSFWYLDALGSAAALGVAEFGRQTLVGSHYGLLDNKFYDPNPDFWVATLWLRLMDDAAIVARSLDDDFHVYSAPAALAFVNFSPQDAKVLHLDDDDDDDESAVVDLWLFTTPDLASKNLLLNGVPVRPARPLRHLDPRTLALHNHTLPIPPLSFGFLQHFSACFELAGFRAHPPLQAGFALASGGADDWSELLESFDESYGPTPPPPSSSSSSSSENHFVVGHYSLHVDEEVTRLAAARDALQALLDGQVAACVFGPTLSPECRRRAEELEIFVFRGGGILDDACDLAARKANAPPERAALAVEKAALAVDRASHPPPSEVDIIRNKYGLS
ncbi:hypothetical protein CTAYLR_001616 [Chrysophaeum taylorii]|uniref:Uncharacterized protein n=1 Tax=Chrysophaeum taylorii TaxID=2483200 RepID=A0AAD7UBW2_9STRA|nr:hypothetical protein CTAYLR_001616 [Chrysophaeum taylorii]